MQSTSPLRRDVLLDRVLPSSHASFLHRSQNSGTLFVVFFLGQGEGAPGNGIALSRFDDAADTWSTPVVLVSDPRFSMQNPVLFDAPGGLLALLHTCQDAGPLGVSQRTSSVLQWTSSDDGRTWTEAPQTVFPRGHGAFIRGPIIAKAANPLHRMLPLYFTPGGEFDHASQMAGVVDSHDGGLTWGSLAQVRTIPGTEGAVGVQPQVVRLPHGELVAFFRNRTERLGHRVGTSVSADDGATWSPLLPTELPSNNSSVAAVVLPDGRVVVAFNNALSARFPLSLAVSSDGGVTFDRVFDLVGSHVQGGGEPGFAGPRGLAGEHSYPSFWLDADRGRLWISWTHQRLTIAICELRLEFFDGPGDVSVGEWNPRPRETTA
jgi:predicted neuraminidase